MVGGGGKQGLNIGLQLVELFDGFSDSRPLPVGEVGRQAGEAHFLVSRALHDPRANSRKLQSDNFGDGEGLGGGGEGLHPVEDKPIERSLSHRLEERGNVLGDAGRLKDVCFGRGRWNEGEVGTGDGMCERPLVGARDIDQDQVRRINFDDPLQMVGQLGRVRLGEGDGLWPSCAIAEPAGNGMVVVEIDDVDGLSLGGPGAGQAPGQGGLTDTAFGRGECNDHAVSVSGLNTPIMRCPDIPMSSRHDSVPPGFTKSTTIRGITNSNFPFQFQIQLVLESYRQLESYSCGFWPEDVEMTFNVFPAGRRKTEFTSPIDRIAVGKRPSPGR